MQSMNKQDEKLENESSAGPEYNGVPLDLYVGVFFTLWAIVGWYSFFNNPQLVDPFIMGSDPGPAFFPKIALVLLSIGGVFFSIKGIFEYNSNIQSDLLHLWITHRRTIVFCMTLIVFVRLIEVLNFSFAGFIFAWGWIYYLAVDAGRETRHAIISSLLVSILITSFLYIVFIYLLDISIG